MGYAVYYCAGCVVRKRGVDRERPDWAELLDGGEAGAGKTQEGVFRVVVVRGEYSRGGNSGGGELGDLVLVVFGSRGTIRRCPVWNP